MESLPGIRPVLVDGPETYMPQMPNRVMSPHQAEKLDRFELARVFGALMWSLSKVINSPEARMHPGSELRLLPCWFWEPRRCRMCS